LTEFLKGKKKAEEGKMFQTLKVFATITIAAISFGLGLRAVAQSTGAQAETVELSRRWGFLPRQVHRQSGEFTLVVRNTTGLAGLQFNLTNSAGAVVGQWKPLGSQPSFQEPVNLTSGTYVLSEQSHAAWTFRLVVGN
jgi:hypothetical protein